MKIKLTDEVHASIDTERNLISVIFFNIVDGKEIPHYHCEFDQYNDEFVEDLSMLVGMNIAQKQLDAVQNFLDKKRPHRTKHTDKVESILFDIQKCLRNCEEQDYNDVESQILQFVWNLDFFHNPTLAKVSDTKQLEAQRSNYDYGPTGDFLLKCDSGNSYLFCCEICEDDY